jgi:hypothetical protein
MYIGIKEGGRNRRRSVVKAEGVRGEWQMRVEQKMTMKTKIQKRRAYFIRN